MGAAAMKFNQDRLGGPEFVPSRMFLYYCTRDIEGSTGWDSGAYIRDVPKAMAKYGVAAEGRDSSGSWEYHIEKFADKPSLASYRHAMNHQALDYWSVPQNRDQIKAAIAAGYLVMFGFDVYESFYDAEVGGIVPMPRSGERILGGHANLLCGFSEGAQWYISQNSWGSDWGDHGFVYFPYAFIESSYSSDFWIVRAQEPGLGRGRL